MIAGSKARLNPFLARRPKSDWVIGVRYTQSYFYFTNKKGCLVVSTRGNKDGPQDGQCLTTDRRAVNIETGPPRGAEIDDGDLMGAHSAPKDPVYTLAIKGL